MKKKMMILMALLALMLLIVPSAFATEVVDSGTCGENLTWVLTDDGTLSISGSGPMTNWEWCSETPWSEIDSRFINKVEISKSVTSIGDYAFHNCWLEGEIIIPESVEVIGKGSFAGCSMSDIIILGNPIIAEHAIGYYARYSQYDPGVWLKDFNLMDESDLVIHGYNNSTAETYAAANGIEFIEIKAPTTEPVPSEPAPSEPTPTEPVPSEPEPTHSFTDVVSGSFYEEAVLWAVENEVTTGRTETTFAPTDPCKRSEVVTFLHRAKGKPAPGSVQSEFTDVQIGKFYTDAVAWAVENNITNGMGDGTFGVSRECTRGQVVTFLWRTAGCPEPTSTEHPFTDLDPDAFYYDAVLWAVENGITSGMSATTFAPGGTCTRAQIVTFLYRFAG